MSGPNAKDLDALIDEDYRSSPPETGPKASDLDAHLDREFGAAPAPTTSANIATPAAAGIAGGLTGYGTTKLLQWAFPGINPSRSMLSGLDRMMQQDFDGKGLKEMFPEYMRLVRDTGKPITFADFIASKTDRAPNTTAFISNVIDQGGKPNAISEQLRTRGEGAKGRVMDMLATELGIPKQTLLQNEDEYKKSRSARAKPLYDEAFKERGPVVHTGLSELFDKHTGAMVQALRAAQESAFLGGRDLDTVMSRDPSHKLFWKNPVSPGDVNEELFAGDLRNKARPYFQPSVEDLHRMREALWSKYEAAKKTSSPNAPAYLDAWKGLTNFMDTAAPEAYRKARQSYKADSDLLRAHEMGSDLMTQNPEDVRRSLLTMNADERQALAKGLYGSLMDKNDPRFAREVISNAPAYKKQKELLSAVFPNTNSLQRFLEGLQGESAMLAGEKAGRGAGTPLPSSLRPDIREAAGAYWAAKGVPTGMLSSVPPPWDPTRSVPRAGTEALFSEPARNPSGWTHPSAEAIHRFNMRPRGLTGALKSPALLIPGALSAIAAALARQGRSTQDEEDRPSPLQMMPGSFLP